MALLCLFNCFLAPNSHSITRLYHCANYTDLLNAFSVQFGLSKGKFLLDTKFRQTTMAFVCLLCMLLLLSSSLTLSVAFVHHTVALGVVRRPFLLIRKCRLSYFAANCLPTGDNPTNTTSSLSPFHVFPVLLGFASSFCLHSRHRLPCFPGCLPLFWSSIHLVPAPSPYQPTRDDLALSLHDRVMPRFLAFGT